MNNRDRLSLSVSEEYCGKEEQVPMNDSARIRSDIVEFLRRELVGPDPRPEHEQLNNGDEVLRPQDPPRLRYSAGVLFPGGAHLNDQENATPDEVEPAESG